MKGEKVRGPRTTHFRSAKKKKETSQVEHVFIMQDAYTAARTGRYRSLLHPQEEEKSSFPADTKQKLPHQTTIRIGEREKKTSRTKHQDYGRMVL